MATYNGDKYLREQLDSILFQTCQDFEFVICDDCSTDDTWKILEEYAQKDSRIKIFKNETNLGFKKNFEKAISLCGGEYVALSDQDDIWAENHLEVLFKNIEGKSAAVGNANVIDGNGLVADHLLSEGDKYFCSGGDIANLYTILCYRNHFSGAISMYAKDFLNVAIPIPDSIIYHDVWLSTAACCMNGLDYTFEPIAKHRVHGNNESGDHHITLFHQITAAFSNGRKAAAEQRIKICDELLKRFPGMPDKTKAAIISIKKYHENRISGRRLKTILFMRKNYKKIFSTPNYNQFILRCIGVLISG